MPSITKRIRAALKAFRLGSAVVDPSTASYGTEPGTYAPTRYGDFLATSVSVYACARLRAVNIASLPACIYKATKDGKSELVTEGNLHGLLTRVNPFWTFNQLLRMTEISLCLWGSAFWVLERGKGGKGVPTEIWWARPDMMRVVPHPENYLAGFLYDYGGQQVPFATSEVVWIRYENPMDEFAGLSPIASARLSIELGMSGLKANRNMFSQGMQIGGILSPRDPNTQWTKPQVEKFQEMLTTRFQGVDRAHKWMVLSQQVQADKIGMSPQDTQVIDQLRWSLADVCRVYGVPPVLVQDFADSTYSNFESALKAVWVLSLRPEAQLISSALQEQLLPHFNGEADTIELSTAEVEMLQESHDAQWTREQGQLNQGAITINEWRGRHGMGPVPWGDVPKGIQSAPPQAAQPPQAEAAPKGLLDLLVEAQTALSVIKADSQSMAYGAEAHVKAMSEFDAQVERWRPLFASTTERTFQALEASVLATLWQGNEARRYGERPFYLDEWIQRFKDEHRAIIASVIKAGALKAFADLGLGLSFDVQSPSVSQFIDTRAQRFAEAVVETTWRQLQDSLIAGEKNGESIGDLAARVRAVMGDRIRSTPEVIARTEVVGGLNGGALLAAKESGVVKSKRWLAAIDDRTRDSHVSAHGQTVPLDDDFALAGGSGPAPGQIGVGAEDIQCRCTLTFITDV